MSRYSKSEMAQQTEIKTAVEKCILCRRLARSCFSSDNNNLIFTELYVTSQPKFCWRSNYQELEPGTKRRMDWGGSIEGVAGVLLNVVDHRCV